MQKSVESMYETVCRIIMSGVEVERIATELSDFYKGLGGVSFVLDNVLYERMGMSCEDVIEVIQSGFANNSC